MVETNYFLLSIFLIFFPFTSSLSSQLMQAYRAFVLRESGRGAAAAPQTPFVNVCEGKGLALKCLRSFLQPALVLSS